jgi:hypothetical protein
MIDLASILVPVVSGMVGGGTALLGQYASQRATHRQHVEDLKQRSVELLASFALPITTRRADALQELFTSLQEILDDKKLSLTNYELVRRQLIFVPKDIADDLLGALSALVQGGRSSNPSMIEQAASELRTVQEALRNAIGLRSIDSYVSQLDELQTETEVVS